MLHQNLVINHLRKELSLYEFQADSQLTVDFTSHVSHTEKREEYQAPSILEPSG